MVLNGCSQYLAGLQTVWISNVFWIYLSFCLSLSTYSVYLYILYIYMCVSLSPSTCLPLCLSAAADVCCQTTLLSGLQTTVFLGAYAAMKTPTSRCKKFYKMTKLAQCTESYQLDG